MPSRKLSVNSNNSVSSQRTSRSNSNEAFCHRTASVHQIAELYSALTDLIHSSPAGRDRNARDPLVRTKSLWSSENNLIDCKITLSPRTSSETLRPARSASCLSSKSCYAAIGSKNTNVATRIVSKNTGTPNKNGICSKIVAKLRGKKFGEQLKSAEHKHVTGEGQIKNGFSGKIHTIDDLLEMTKLQVNAATKTNSNDKRKKVKPLGRKKAHSFDSCEGKAQDICVHKVSSKLKTWYTRAASYAATMETEEHSRAESSGTGSTENFLESSGYGSRDDTINLEEKENEEHIVRDFDVSSNDALGESKTKDICNKIVEIKPYPVNKLERRAYSDLNSKVSSFLLDRSCGKNEYKDNSFEGKKEFTTRALSQTHWNNENRCDLIRRLSLNIVDDVLARKSASCAQIGSCHLSRDLSKRKVQQWLKNLHSEGKGKDNLDCKEKGGVVSSNDTCDGQVKSKELVQNSPKSSAMVIEGQEYAERHNAPSRGGDLAAEALFYIPNIEQTDQPGSVNMLLNF